MRKRKPLTQIQRLKQSIMRLEGNNRALHQNFTAVSAELRQTSDQLRWMTEQRVRDRLMIEHLLETVQFSAMKDVQPGVAQRR